MVLSLSRYWLALVDDEDNYRIAASPFRFETNNLDGVIDSAALPLAALTQLFSGSFGSLGSILRSGEPSDTRHRRESHRDFSPVGFRIIKAFLREAPSSWLILMHPERAFLISSLPIRYKASICPPR